LMTRQPSRRDLKLHFTTRARGCGDRRARIITGFSDRIVARITARPRAIRLWLLPASRAYARRRCASCPADTGVGPTRAIGQLPGAARRRQAAPIATELERTEQPGFDDAHCSYAGRRSRKRA